jgi:hypothetical protein
MVMSVEVDRGCAWRDHEGGHCVFSVDTGIGVSVRDGRVGLVYKNNVHRTCGIRVEGPIIMSDNLAVGSTGYALKYMSGYPISVVLGGRQAARRGTRRRNEFVDEAQCSFF